MRKRSINYYALITTLALAMATAGLWPGAPSSDLLTPEEASEFNSCTTQNRTFQEGEEVTYKMFYNWKFVWVAAGEVTFRVKDMGNQYYLSAVGRTYRSYDPFFKVRDTYECYVDKKTMLPTVSIRQVEEGKYRLYDKVTFDRKRKVAKSLRGKSKETAEIAEYPIDNCIHDILSIIYFARNVDFADMNPGEKIPIDLFMDKETWPLSVTYRGQEEQKRIKGNGKFNTMVFSPQLISGEYFREGDEMKVYVSDDKNRLPLIIESPLSVGSVKAVLKDYKGLKYEMTADL
ncbi:MAG TPA: DUF3108 domain-containing protein [Saprospiraceae bacterium]|nr:DUF3108 domain-containing protein [Saprospiraceae bacterium]